MGMKFWHELSRGEQKEKLRNYERENFLTNIKWKPVVCLVTYVKFRVLGPSVQTEHYTLNHTICYLFFSQRETTKRSQVQTLPTSQVYTFLFTCVSSLLFHFITTFFALSLYFVYTHRHRTKGILNEADFAPSLFYTDPSWHFFVNKIKGAPKTPKTPKNSANENGS